MNKFTLVLGLSISAALLAGCGGGSSSNDDNNASSSGGSSSGGSSSGGSSSGGSSSGGSSSGGSSSGGSSSGGSSSGGSSSGGSSSGGSSSGGSSSGGSSSGGSSSGGSSSGGSSSGGSSSGGSSSAVNGINPVVPLTIQKTNSSSFQGKSYTQTLEGGYIGDFQVINVPNTVAGTTINDLQIQLAPNASLNVTDVQKTTTGNITCQDGYNGRGTETFDYSSGKVSSAGTLNGQTISCSSLFSSPLPTTISSNSDLNLFDNWGEDDDINNASQTGLIRTTCPQDNSNEFNTENRFCNGSFLTNYTITTSDPHKVHKFSTKYTTQWQQ